MLLLALEKMIPVSAEQQQGASERLLAPWHPASSLEPVVEFNIQAPKFKITAGASTSRQIS
jgi:hypothetical protein